MVKNDLSKFFITKTEAAEFCSNLAQISQQVYQTGFSLEQALIRQFGVEKKDLLIQLFKEENINWQDNSALSGYFSKMQADISKMPNVTITIPCAADTTMMTKISDWLLLNTNGQMTMTFELDRNLVGGAVINFKGKFYDGSIRSKFMEAAYGSNV